ncbi:MAG TPA: Ku protein [Candidatus Sulfotelmatobacter sp.]|nr:Ku protein [Candidatus Sulfotelmatobacter sp.]
MRPLWTGAISFGLVNIPVGLYSATSHKPTVDLDLLRDSDLSRIHYKKVAEADGKEVPREHIVKGFEYEKGKYVVLDEEDFQRVQIRSNQTVDIREFVCLADVEPRFFDEPYFLAPEKGGAKAYVLLRTALEQTGLAGVAKVVIRPPREHLALVKPLDGVLVLETMHFADELRDPAELQAPKAAIGQKELDMAVSLVKTMAVKWDPSKYEDEYRECLMKVIEQKVKAGAKKMPAPKPAPKPGHAKIIDLVSLLQESLGQSQKASRAKSPRRRMPQKKAA